MFYNGDTYTAEIKGFDRNNDIAVLKIDATGLMARHARLQRQPLCWRHGLRRQQPLGELNSPSPAAWSPPPTGSSPPKKAP